VGSFFRTCDAFQVEKIHLTGYTSHPPRIEISKTAIGAEKSVPWEHHKSPLEVAETLKSEGWKLIALEIRRNATPLSEFSPSGDVCLIVGHELEGIPEELLNLCDATVMIPMLGKKESLNVAVAAGIALHHLKNCQ
jgi:tRNA G18 (ribose-2'-O)-methylase SpoU